MPYKRIDYTGQRFGWLLVLGYAGNIKHNTTWACLCDCGKTKTIRASYLRGGFAKSCGCNRISRMRETARMTARARFKEDNWVKDIRCAYLNMARKRGLAFELTDQETREILFLECHYCGAPPSNLYTRRIKMLRGDKKYYSGIDRVDNSIGYRKDNCVPCCKQCNVAKNNRTVDEFLAHASRIAEKWPARLKAEAA